MANIENICFDHEDFGGMTREFFLGVERLEDGETLEDRVNASFASDELAIDWLRKSYKGRDIDGVGIVVDGVHL